MTRRYAEDTSVPVAKSRGEIDELLRSWRATGIQWTDDFDVDRVTLRFRWPTDGVTYLARFGIRLRPAKELRTKAMMSRGISESRFRDLMARRGRSEHRVLLLWLKAAFNAVDAGIVSAETLFLPFLEGTDGQTVAEVATPHLAGLLSGSAARLLGAGGP